MADDPLDPKNLPDPTREQMSAFLKLFFSHNALFQTHSDRLHESLQPFICEMCPLGAETSEPYHEISNDLSEAHYKCPILRKEVWGEQPQCGTFGYKVLIKALMLVKQALDDKQ